MRVTTGASALLSIVLCGACDSDSDHGGEHPADAHATDVSLDPKDAPFTCVPVAPALPGPACLALDPSALRGDTPFGSIDVALDYFGAGDCITISSARIGWTGACGEQLQLQFSYPVVSTSSGRQVTQSFDSDARFEFKPPGMAPREHITTIHVDVVRWQEGQGTHDIDITISVTDPRYAVAPWRIHGTFCDWPYYIC